MQQNSDTVGTARTPAIPATMTALKYERYGPPSDVVTLQTVDVPTPTADQVLIEVAASSVNALDWHLITGVPRFARVSMGLRRPKRAIPGADVSGTVVAIGSAVKEIAPGDRVFGEIGGGGFAEYVAVDAGLVAPAPSNISIASAAALGVAALTALQGLRDWGRMRPGHSVLINGASGGVGTFAIQIAKALGAGHVAAVCSTRNVGQAEALGADSVIDYTATDFRDTERTYDVFFDNAASCALTECRRLLTADGTYVMVAGPKGSWIDPIPRMLGALVRSQFWSQNLGVGTAHTNPEDLRLIADFVAAEKVSPMIERTLSLKEAIGAIDEQGEFHARAKTLIRLETN